MPISLEEAEEIYKTVPKPDLSNEDAGNLLLACYGYPENKKDLIDYLKKIPIEHGTIKIRQPYFLEVCFPQPDYKIVAEHINKITWWGYVTPRFKNIKKWFKLILKPLSYEVPEHKETVGIDRFCSPIKNTVVAPIALQKNKAIPQDFLVK
jgi:protoheme ferro-lyase